VSLSIQTGVEMVFCACADLGRCWRWAVSSQYRHSCPADTYSVCGLQEISHLL